MPSLPADGEHRPVSLAAEIYEPLSGRRVTAQTKKLSGIGCEVASADMVHAGTIVRLRIERDGVRFQVWACVVRAVSGGIDLEFLEIEPTQAALLKRWLSDPAG